jgi:hypothetical protein
MEWWLVLVIVGIVIGAAILIAAFLADNRRRGRLREGFGDEYDVAVGQYGSRRRAERELTDREKRVEKLNIRALSDEARRAYTDRWQQAQARFVDDPTSAIGDADRLVGEVMRERGYPVEDFREREADLSVYYPDLVRHYRMAHAIAERNRGGSASTEDLRQAVIHYRALFNELLVGRESQAERASSG